ncbi:beta-lactamase class A/beta-lactamase class A VEB [Sphingobacterium allocomposti]|jgi:beta-lactamase class A|uniref:beta-lactamase n=2 Tax=Sphingobacterium allocomposti TaxID=415956 RepID=A0A5S5DIG0_9SPHI|nr:beta-lactamase class A/beta-lactamase class A VEB [Sphingobacterium composti Yoo et al. 2007 non Ten et al. 2007]
MNQNRTIAAPATNNYLYGILSYLSMNILTTAVRTLAFASLSIFYVHAQEHPLQPTIQKLLSKKKALVGVSIIHPEHRDTLNIRGDEQFPMQSVFKFHIATAMLAKVDEGRFSLHQVIPIKKEDLTPEIWSPLRDQYPDGVNLPLSKIITYMLSQSDNVACDVLLKLLGGPLAVETYIKSKGIQDIAIRINEETMQNNWDLQFQNWTTPKACTQTLQLFYYNRNQELSASCHKFLWDVMKGTETGAKRLKGGLPAGTVVAHKTGFSGTRNGITEAVHDAGIIFLPSGQPIFITVFVSHSQEDTANNEAIIADIAKLVYDYYATREL